MWIWRKMEKISWTAKVSNSEVPNRVKENSCIINTISQWKRRWLGHVLRHDVLLRDILECRMTGKGTRGRKRLQLMSNICEGYETAKKRAEDRCLWCVALMGVSDLLNSRIPVVVLSAGWDCLWYIGSAAASFTCILVRVIEPIGRCSKLCFHLNAACCFANRHTKHTTVFIALLDFVWDYPGEPASER